MPPFPARESALLNRLHKKGRETEDKRTWNLDGRERRDTNGSTAEVNSPTAQVDLAAQQAYQREQEQRNAAQEEEDAAADLTMMGVWGGVNGATDSILDSLAGLDLSSSAVQEEQLLPASSPTARTPAASLPSSFPVLSGGPASTTLTQGANIDKWFDRLSYTGEGVLYEDAQLQIGVKTEFHGSLGRVQLYVGNKLPVPLTSFTCAVDSPNPSAIVATLAQLPANQIAPLTQVQQQIQVECKECFASPPIVRITYVAGSLQTLALRLPVTITQFIEPVKLPQAVFFERWKLIGGPPRESQTIL